VNSDPVLRQSRWFWPIVLFPYAVDDSHTRSFAGRTVLPDVKSSFSRAVITLTGDHLRVQGRITRRTHLVIPLTGIASVAGMEGKRGIVDIRFDDATWGPLARAVTSGQPPGSRSRILLNVVDADEWIGEISERAPRVH
jgi:hypothetical protein